ncbi:MAG: hypothetical protein ACFFD4_27970 [Candidatus Odinarchaeota archaeon]
MEILLTILLGLLAAFIAVICLYGLAYWLQLADWPKTKLKQQLYQSGETVVPRKRRYLEQTFVWLSYFSTAHVIGLMLATLIALTVFGVVTFDIWYPVVYIIFTGFAILTLARQQSSA